MYPSSGGKLLNFLKSIDIPAFLDGTSKTLNVINQAIPVYYQVKPLIGNMGTIFKISNAINSKDFNNSSVSDNKTALEAPTVKTHNSPIFYV